MQKEINLQQRVINILPSAVEIPSYDNGVWGDFKYLDKNYQVFDRWNFGENISENNPERFLLSAVNGDPMEESSYEELGFFASAEEAARSLL